MKKRVLFFLILILLMISQVFPWGLKWIFETDGSIYSSPAIGSDGTIYVGSSDQKLYAISSDRVVKWEFLTGGAVNSTPAIGSKGTIYVGSSDDKLYAINPDGTKKWEFITEGNVTTSPAIGTDGTIYVGSGDNKLYAIRTDGTKKWEFLTGGGIYTSPSLASDGTIYVGSYDNKLYAINPDGSKKWDFLTGGDVASSPAIGSDGTIYMGSWEGKLYAFNPNGTIKWEFLAGKPVMSSPSIDSNGTIYFGTYIIGTSGPGPYAKLFAIDSNGTMKWEFETDHYVIYSPTIGDDFKIYVGSWGNTDDNKLYALSSTGAKLWEFDPLERITTSPLIGKEGTLYVSSADGKLYAMGIPSTGLNDSSWPMFGANAKRTGIVTLSGISGYLVPNDIIWGMCKIYVKVDSTNLNAENLYITIDDDMTKFAMEAMNEGFQSSVSFNELIFSDTITTIKVWYNDKLYDSMDVTEGGLYPGAQLTFEGLQFTSASEGGRVLLYEMKPGVEKPGSTVKSFSVRIDGDVALKMDNPLGQSGALLHYEDGRWICVSYSKEELVFNQEGDYVLVNDTVGAYIPRITGNALKQNYPNPFNPETNIDFELEEGGHVTLEIFDSRGRKVITLADGDYPSGIHSVHWAGKDARDRECASGIYYCILKVNGKRHIKKMVMLK